MKSPAPRALLVLLVGASPSIAQLSPGVSAKPSGRTLDDPAPAPAERPVDLGSREPPSLTRASATDVENQLLDAARQGNAWAQMKLATAYMQRPTTPVRFADGVRWLKAAAAQNEADALYLLGSLAAAGRGVAQSTSDAFDYCRRAAELGHANAQYELATFFAQGVGTEPDRSQALAWARKAAAQNHAKARYAVARELLQDGNPEFRAEALENLQRAAAAGLPEAVEFLQENRGVADSPSEALEPPNSTVPPDAPSESATDESTKRDP